MSHALPYYEQQTLYDRIQEGGPLSNIDGVPTGRGGSHPLWSDYVPYRTKVATVLCPSDGGGFDSSFYLAKNNYVACMGDSIRNNQNSTNNRGVFSHVRGTSIRDIKDGASNTAHLSETTIHPPRGGSACNNLHGCYTIMAGLDNNPAACLATRGPNNTVRRNRTASHASVTTDQRRGGAMHAGFSMITGFTTVLPPNSPMAEVSGNGAFFRPTATIQGVSTWPWRTARCALSRTPLMSAMFHGQAQASAIKEEVFMVFGVHLAPKTETNRLFWSSGLLVRA